MRSDKIEWKDLGPYWNAQYKENVELALSHVGIKDLATDSISLNEAKSERVGKSWRLVKSKRVKREGQIQRFYPSDLSKESYKVTKSRRILLRPSKEQGKILRIWFGHYRYTFNWVVKRKEREYLENCKTTSYMQSRKNWIKDLREEAPWIEGAPAHTIYGAMMDADQAYKLAVKKCVLGQKTELPKCRRKTQKSFFILGNGITSKGIYTRFLGKMRSSEPIPNKPRDSRIILECGRWYLCYPETSTVQPAENQGRICAVDPGVRTFASVFSQNMICKIGQGSFGRIVRLCHYLDDLVSRLSKEKARVKQKMKKAASRMRRKIRRLVDDLHYQTIGWLFRNYDTVIFPDGNFSSCCEKIRRKIGRKSVRSLLTFSFGRFRDRLLHKAKCLGKVALTVNEAWTSKTANWTGEIVQNLKGQRSIKSGGLTFDRDINGALGIFLKALVVHPFSVDLSAVNAIVGES